MSFPVELDADGNPTKARTGSHDWNISSAKAEGKTLTLTGNDREGEAREFRVTMPGEPSKMAREAGKSTGPTCGTSARNYATVLRPVQIR